jgi:hypothetical protein
VSSTWQLWKRSITISLLSQSHPHEYKKVSQHAPFHNLIEFNQFVFNWIQLRSNEFNQFVFNWIQLRSNEFDQLVFNWIQFRSSEFNQFVFNWIQFRWNEFNQFVFNWGWMNSTNLYSIGFNSTKFKPIEISIGTLNLLNSKEHNIMFSSFYFILFYKVLVEEFVEASKHVVEW